eukprot:CAMPEP_0114609288 /NCGR_PEP_ID=MMETSP0168-20121206/3011_1 /TAXON_ID=95228 ORGANISM="Vannella sp., Strain DIVA3 517/6/12" /NCGR_SAMPLE_ID=MMETSP0168 /ASSEMBLY_ACC=CAM_ASM_000044 /LENGTH=77 /DNA_ID=CAMNT_0001820201 /DNA_START=23 /DNA_END=253 /DNA_ORIENTATION=-
MLGSFYSLLEAVLLFVNAIAILDQQRFLVPIGWMSTDDTHLGGERGIKSRIVDLIEAVHLLLRIPLIFINVSAIILY